MTSSNNPGRGALILVFGILGLVLCPILAPVAWLMGSGDLKRITAGEIASEARGLTQAGMICGIIGTVLVCLGIVVWLFMLLFLGAGAALSS